MADKTLSCKDCSAEFTFTQGEQDFYAEKGFTNEPQRCPGCRSAKKQQSRNSDSGNGGFSTRSSGFNTARVKKY